MPDYIQDPNNSKKQVPGPQPDNYYDRADNPATASLVKAPNSVYINTAGGNFGFFFGSSASFSSKATSEGGNSPGVGLSNGTLTGSQHYVNFGALALGTRLDIHPTAWSGSQGSVTFIYKGGLDGSGRP